MKTLQNSEDVFKTKCLNVCKIYCSVEIVYFARWSKIFFHVHNLFCPFFKVVTKYLLKERRQFCYLQQRNLKKNINWIFHQLKKNIHLQIFQIFWAFFFLIFENEVFTCLLKKKIKWIFFFYFSGSLRINKPE